jgi:non-ribosomal peptide synthetase component E (peptide arylation enzyme)
VRAGDRVLVRLPNSLDYPTAFFGAMKRGAIAVPTSTLLTAEEVVYLAQGLRRHGAGDRQGDVGRAHDEAGRTEGLATCC